ncbi:hypothetical protein ES705_02120 [subsurface metagenome]|nr:DUF362 domain-containing protein [Clostridia bacterium]
MSDIFEKKFSRREFLKMVSLLGTTVFLGNFFPLKQRAKTSAVLVGIARGDSIADSVRRAINLAGGLHFIKSGESVLIKPNVNSDDPHPGTTNPEVVFEVVNMVREKGAKRIIVADRSNPWWDTLKAMKKVGIYEAAVKGGAEVVVFGKGDYVKVNPENSYHWPNGFRIPRLVKQVDHIISLPVAKTHIIADFTMGIKNWVGLIPPSDRKYLHLKKKDYFANMLSEIHLARKPSFLVMDATKVFVSGGPSHGDIARPGLVIATSDLVANDVTGLALLKTLGTIEEIQRKSVWDQPQIKRAVELGLGINSPSEIILKTYGISEEEKIRKQLIS